jgi:hypothetical protein
MLPPRCYRRKSERASEREKGGGEGAREIGGPGEMEYMLMRKKRMQKARMADKRAKRGQDQMRYF